MSRPNELSTICCSAFSGSPRWRARSSACSPSKFSRGPSAVSSRVTVAAMPKAPATRSRKSTIGYVGSAMSVLLLFSGVGLTAADTLQLALGRRANRSHVRRADDVVRRVLLADLPDVADQPVNRKTRGCPQKHEREHDGHEHHHLLLRRINAGLRHRPLLPE